MAEAKPFASLSSGLLARKGAAKPAMRPQGFGQGMNIEDLGWNDMGYGQPPATPPAEHVPSSIAALTPAPRSPAGEGVSSPPPVVEQQRAIKASFSAEPEPEQSAPPAEALADDAGTAEAEVTRLPLRPRSAPGSKGKAAFTLRLNPERHLKLRLACAVTHRSAQQIVTDALESFLASLPELDSMAGHVPAKLGKRS
jgi:hypothetical protein